MHYLGPVRTFYTELFRNIKDKDHRNINGTYLDTGYDDAMQSPLFEMAGIERIEYVPEICYFYNRYENNDGFNGKTD